MDFQTYNCFKIQFMRVLNSEIQRVNFLAKLIAFSLVVGFVSVFAYGYSASAPLYAQLKLNLSPSGYGYWNMINMVGMCASGFLSAYLIKKYDEKYVLVRALFLLIPGILSLILLSTFHVNNAYLFFISTCYLYLTSGLLFPTASYFASTAIADKASASSVMSFVNMGSAMIGVIVMGYLPFQAIGSFTVVLCVFFVIICGLMFWQIGKTT